MLPPSEMKSWILQSGEERYLCTTDPNYIQVDALNAALESDMLWWAKALNEAELRKLVENSLNIGLYHVPQDIQPDQPIPAAMGDNTSRPMVGYARVITDYVTFAYLTDVYVLPQHQGKGLGTRMMECLNQILDAWPELRRFMLITSDPAAIRIYEKTLGAKEMAKGKLLPMVRIGPAGKSPTT